MGLKFMVETSARHIHLSPEHVEMLFGKGATLTPKKALSQPDQFAAEERVTIVGPKKEIANVVILGPSRAFSQVEISLTDARTLGIDAPVRESGDIVGSAGCKLVGPMGEVELTEGVIAAKRHIHMTTENAKACGVADKQIVSVKISGTGRSLIFDDTVVRVSDKFNFSMHIDTDESNAAFATGKCFGEITEP